MKGRLFLAISAAASTAAIAVACGSFGSAASESDAGTTDAAADAPLTEGGATDGGSSGPKGCKGPNVRLEETFEGASSIGADWVPVTDSTARSDPDGLPGPSLFAETKQLNNGARSDQAVVKAVALDGDQGVCIELDVFLEQMNSALFTVDAYAEILELQLPNEDGVLYVEVKPAGLSLTHGGKHAPLTSFQYGKWQHLVVNLPYSSSREPSLDGDNGDRVTTPTQAGSAPSALRVKLGIQSSSAAGTAQPLRVHIDNVRMVTTP